MDTAVLQMRRADGVAVASGGQSLRQQIVEVTADLQDLVVTENANAFEITIPIEACDFITR